MMNREEYAGIPGIHDEKPPESGQELPKGNRGLFLWEPYSLVYAD
jgi:hypothetical protein